MSNPADRKYAETHEWFKIEGNAVTVGISQFAADELTDITYFELPSVGSEVAPGESCGGIESVKAYAELYCAIPGKVTAVNDTLADNPGLVNEDAFDKGWIFKMEASDLSPADKLMDAAAYGKHIA